jgi:hypothetical protein
MPIERENSESEGDGATVVPVTVPPVREFSALAIIAFCLSLLWLGGIGSVVGAVLGGLSIGRTRRLGQSGQGLAVAALIISVLGLAGTGVLLAKTYQEMQVASAQAQSLLDQSQSVLAAVPVATSTPPPAAPPTPAATTVGPTQAQQAQFLAKTNAALASNTQTAPFANSDDSFLLSSGGTTCDLRGYGQSAAKIRATTVDSLSDRYARAIAGIITTSALTYLCP